VEVSVVWWSGADSPDAASLLLRDVVATILCVARGDVLLSRSCPQCGSSDHGRPVVLPVDGNPSPHVSLGRAGDLAVVAVSPEAPVGVDVERLDAPRFAGFDAVALHPHEIAPTLETRAVTWVRKESLLKATGDGLHVDPRRILLSDPDQPPRLVEWAAPRPPVEAAWMRDLDIDGHAGCVTVLADTAPDITVRQGAPAARAR
jgi:4'-phosphopantetheinyl transferase